MHFAKFAQIYVGGIPRPLTYGVPDDLMIEVGTVAIVPLGKGQSQGIVSDITNHTSLDQAKIKPVLQSAPLEKHMANILQLCQSLARYYLCPWPQIYSQFVNHDSSVDGYIPFYQITETFPASLTPTQKKLHQLIAKNPGIGAFEIYQNGFSKRTIECLKKVNAIEKSSPKSPQPAQLVQLNTQQQAVVDKIALDTFNVSLLWGVTGSGKTECFTHLIHRLADKNKQCLVLVPEIGLVDQTASKIQKRLNETVACYHSQMNKNEKESVTRALTYNEIRIVVATRSGVFLPFTNLQFIIVDEEHDSSYQQETGWLYQGRDVAIWRAKHENIPILLASATPSLSSINNAYQGKFNLYTLSQKALNSSEVITSIVDIKDQKLQAGFAQSTLKEIAKTLAKNQHVIIFVPRRGYSTRYLCEGCGWIAQCPNCSTGLVYHAKRTQLLCHHCNYQTASMNECPECHLHEPKPIGYGTEQVSAYLSQHFQHPVWCADSDHIENASMINEKVKQLQHESAHLIVGTQMISKGHDFKRVGLVIIHQADFCMHPADPYSAEKFVQQFFQIKGRAARDPDQNGHIIIQTRRPDNELIQQLHAGNLKSIIDHTLEDRLEANMPPHCAQAKIIAKSKHPQKALEFLTEWKNSVSLSEATWLGPAPCIMEKRAGYYRFQSHILSASRAKLLQNLAWIKKNTPQKNHYSLICTIEMDPLDA